MRISGGKALISSDQSITLSGPEGSPYSDIMQAYYTVAPDCFIAFFRRETKAPLGYPFGSAFSPFDKGKYTVALNNKDHSMKSLNEYMNGELVDPENFVYQTMVQLNGSNADQLCQIGALCESPEAKTNTELYNFELQNTTFRGDVTR